MEIKEINGWKIIRDDYRDIHAAGFVEALCSHGIGHHNGTHGCDGCCKEMPKEIQGLVTTD